MSIISAHPHQTPTLHSAAQRSASEETVKSGASTLLSIPEPLDVAVRDYCDWQCSRFGSEIVKKEYHKACDATLAECLDLELVYKNRNPAFYMEMGVKSGVAQRFIRDIKTWAKQCNGL